MILAVDINIVSLIYILQDDRTKGCKCPPGFRGDGVNSCEGLTFSGFSIDVNISNTSIASHQF